MGKVKSATHSNETEIRKFYNEEGWRSDGNAPLLDTRVWGGRTPLHRALVRTAEVRIGNEFSRGGELFCNIGCGPVTEAAKEYSSSFRESLCVDISEVALSLARSRLGHRGKYLCGSLTALPLSGNVADATFCEHTLYHVDAARQEEAVRELIRITKPGRPIVIIYSNPGAPLNRLEDWHRRIGINRLHGGGKLYFFRYDLKWWSRFSEVCDVEFLPFDPISVRQAKVMVPHRILQHVFFGACTLLERKSPRLALQMWDYPAIILRKRA